MFINVSNHKHVSDLFATKLISSEHAPLCLHAANTPPPPLCLCHSTFQYMYMKAQHERTCSLVRVVNGINIDRYTHLSSFWTVSERGARNFS